MKNQLAFSYITQAYSSLVGIVMMPLYLHYLGGEVFGLVGFSIMIQAWIQALDMGMSPALSREMSRFRAGTLAWQDLALRLRSIEFLQVGLGAFAVLIILSISSWVAEKWLHAVQLRPNEVTVIVGLIVVAAVLRWFSGLYRASLIGLEKQYVVNGLSLGFTTLRYIGVLPLLTYFPEKQITFFIYQTVLNLLELVLSASIVYRTIPFRLGVRPTCAAIGAVFPLASGVAFLSVVWIAMTQTDKLVLSGMLSLNEYGHFMLGVMAAGGVLLLIAPIQQVLQPRMTILVESGEYYQLEALYRLSTQFSAIGFWAIGGGLACFSQRILELWTGDHVLSETVAPILFWYSLAYIFVGIQILPLVLQLAWGQLRLHIIGNLILFVTMIPALIIGAIVWGAVGTGKVFLLGNAFFLLVWVPRVHKQFFPNLNWGVHLKDALLPGVIMMAWYWLVFKKLPEAQGLFNEAAWMLASLLIAVMLGGVASDHVRVYLLRWLRLNRA